jgi:hypothetical protein
MTTRPIVTRIRYNRASAAEQLNISLRQLDYLRSTGKLIGRKDGGSVYFDHEELTSYARSCPSEGGE